MLGREIGDKLHQCGVFHQKKKMLTDWRYDIQCLSSWSAMSQNFKLFRTDCIIENEERIYVYGVIW